MNITIIIPIHKINDEINEYLKKAILSIEKQVDVNEKPKLILVYPPDIENEIKLLNFTNLDVSFVENNGNVDYQSQINLAVELVNTDYFTVLEFDDELSNTYLKNAVIYIQNYPEIDILLTIIIEVNDNNEGIKLTNELAWAQQFVGENGDAGYLNLNTLKQYTDFKLSGAIIKKLEFKNLGKYKSKIKLTFMYELLLRALNNGCKIFTIPKIGYKHLATRNDSLFSRYKEELSINERKYWFDVAVKESNFTNDRDIEPKFQNK